MPHHALDDLTPLSWAPITRDDLPELADLITAIEHLDDAVERHTLDDLITYFDGEGSDPEFATALGRDRGGSPAAWAWNRRLPEDRSPVRIWLRGGVHPVWRSQQVGRKLLDWQIGQARAWYHRDCRPEADGPLRLISYADQKLHTHQNLLTGAGLEPTRWFVDMIRPTLTDVQEPTVPAGVQLLPLTPDRFEAARRAHNEAFERAWGAEPVAAEAWTATLRRRAARPEWSWIAVDAENPDEVVGYAICSSFQMSTGACGWIDHLGVRHAWRGRGIASAVVTACLRSFARNGLPGAGLGVDVDDPENALGLYQRLGYEAADTMIMYVRDEGSADGRSLQVGHHQAQEGGA